jgi:hypothetical protein
MLANVLQVAGAVSIVVGVAWMAGPWAFIVGGILAILLGVGAARKAR